MPQDFDAKSNVVRFGDDPGKTYNALLEKDFENASPDSQQSFLAALQGGGSVQITAGPHVATSIARSSDGRVNVFFANFTGLVGGVNPIQTPLTGVEVTVKSKSESATVLPFMGVEQSIKGSRNGESISFKLPTITKGAVFSYTP